MRSFLNQALLAIFVPGLLTGARDPGSKVPSGLMVELIRQPDKVNILSENSSAVEFGGGELKPNTTYFWKVRIWNIRFREGYASGARV